MLNSLCPKSYTEFSLSKFLHWILSVQNSLCPNSYTEFSLSKFLHWILSVQNPTLNSLYPKFYTEFFQIWSVSPVSCKGHIRAKHNSSNHWQKSWLAVHIISHFLFREDLKNTEVECAREAEIRRAGFLPKDNARKAVYSDPSKSESDSYLWYDDQCFA